MKGEISIKSNYKKRARWCTLIPTLARWKQEEIQSSSCIMSSRHPGLQGIASLPLRKSLGLAGDSVVVSTCSRSWIRFQYSRGSSQLSDFSSRRFCVLFPPGIAGTNVVHIHTCQPNSYTESKSKSTSWLWFCGRLRQKDPKVAFERLSQFLCLKCKN